ncbi:MAG: flagellar export protein FliJ [Treponema sp.]|jgi:flagellar export protein FliJ|nr:flagellar export protein FliJ [Treponema sp.]
MKQFSFDLESILDIRKHREQEAEIALGKAVRDLTRIERNIVAVANEKSRVSLERFALGYGVAEILTFDRYVQRLDAIKERLIKDAAQAELKVEAAREVYLEASRNRDALDKVKSDEAAAYRKEIFNEEAKVLDDIAGSAFVKRRSLEGIHA